MKNILTKAVLTQTLEVIDIENNNMVDIQETENVIGEIGNQF